MEENNVNETPVENEVVETTAFDAAEVENLKAEIDEANDRYKRLFAEFENYKKRTQKDRENIYGMVTSDVVSTMLPIMDNLEKASSVKTEDLSYQEGVNLVVKQFASALRNLGTVFNILDIKETLITDLKEYVQLPITDDLRRDILDTTNDYLNPMVSVRFYNYAFQDVTTDVDLANDTLRYRLTLSPTRYAQKIYVFINIVKSTFDFSILQSV